MHYQALEDTFFFWQYCKTINLSVTFTLAKLVTQLKLLTFMARKIFKNAHSQYVAGHVHAYMVPEASRRKIVL